jgi:hypothetical protein
VFAASDIAVTIANNLGVETALVLGSDYSVTLNANQDTSPGGTVTYPISGSALPTGSRLTIFGNLPYDQPLDLPSGGNFSPLALENQLDRQLMQTQQLLEQVGRAVKAPVVDASVDMTMPAASERANRYLSFDLTGRPVATTFDVDAVQNASTAAIAAAAAAAQSEADAAASEANAIQAAATVASTVASVTPSVVRYSGNGSTSAFTLPSTPGAEENTLVFISGVYQQKDQYSVVGTTLTFSEAPPAGTDNIEVQIGPAVQIALDSAFGVSYQPAGVGAVATTVQSKLRETVSVKDFGAVGDGVTDDTAAIQAALDYAATFVVNNANEESQQSGGLTVYAPRGTYKISDTLVVAPGVSLVGDGKMSTVIQNTTTDKTLIRNSLGAVYNAAGSEIADLALYGSRTSANQWGLDLLRWLNGVVRNVYAQNMGAGGYRLRQCICCTFDQVESHLSVGPGILTGQGITTWSDTTLNNLPTNACVFVNCHMNRNDGAGIKLGPRTNGCVIQGGAYENNYFTAGNNVGYNIELVNTASFMPNEFLDVWCEGPVQCHVYVDAGIDVSNRFTRFHHFGNGATGNVDRSVIVNSGQLILTEPTGHGGAYKTIAGSKAPFRIVKPNGIIFLNEPRGSTIGLAGDWVEDAVGASTGLENHLYQTGYGVTRGNTQKHYMDSGAVAVSEWYRSGDTQPLVRVEPFYKSMSFGPGGSTAPDVRIGRRSAGVFGPMSAGMSLGVDGAAGATLNFSNNVGNGSAATTLGSVGPTGANAGNPLGWLRINVSGTDRYVPYW